MAVEISPHQFCICQEANGQFCNIPTPFPPLANPPSCITGLYTKNTVSISNRCLLQIRKSSDANMPSQLTPNVWILTMAPSAVTTTITLNCPGEIMKFITVKKPIHVLWLPTILSCYIIKFSSTPALWNCIFGCKYIFGYGKSPHDQHFITQLLHMATIGEAPEWESATTLGLDTLSSSRMTLQPHGQGHSKYCTFFTCTVNRRYRFNLDTVFTYRSLCNGYRIAYTSRFGNILLLFLLVLTCQISVPTCTTRCHAIYNCGWWCRGSTHLQMWWQGLTACMSSQESWPAYRAYTHMDRESV